MKRFELEVEHQYKNKFVNRHRFTLKNGVLVVGSSRTTDIRLLGDGVSEIHAYLECQNGSWSIIDASSTQGTWLNKEPITHESIQTEKTIHIGAHQLKLIPHTFENEVFSDGSVKRGITQGALAFHQVIVRKSGLLMSTDMVEAHQPYTISIAEKNHTLAAPKVGEIKETELGDYKIVQRIVQSDRLHMGPREIISGVSAKEARTPAIALLVMAVILMALIFAIPNKPNEELNEVKPNQYTRLIYDAELIKKKRAEAKEMRKTIMASAKKSPEPQKAALTTPVKSKGATPKVVSQLKLEGLSALIGKIAKRANVKGPTVAGFGKSADDPNTGHAVQMASVGSSAGAINSMIGNGGSTYKVGGVGTLGKGGGNARQLAGISGLAAGGAGSGTVGILDEETEIEGGLDKEVIAKVIANYLGEIRYCYERQLSAEPEIYGKVQVKFTIDANGAVLENKIGTTTLKSAMVEGCILRRMARWKFPKPKGGTHVLVSYPFMFKSTN